jgi:ribosomal protein S18 acetylase RimI-like enzyme
MVLQDLEAVCEVVGLAFATNPSTLANVRGDPARATRVMRDAVRVAKFGRRWSYALVAVQHGEIVGALNAAEWPHCQLGLAEKIKTAPAMLGVWRGALPRAFKMMARREAHDPHRPHWHVGPVGVRPGLQGQGIGKALLHQFLLIVDRQAAAAFLETDVDRNVMLYQRFGFAVTTRETILGVDTRFMWREAQTTAHGAQC